MAKATKASPAGRKEPAPDPSQTSADYEAMIPDWDMIGDILAGIRTIRSKTTQYLPKYPAEDETEYARRVAQAPWRHEFEDSLTSLVAKPFAKDIQLVGAVPPPVKDACENIDGMGNNLTQFAREGFKNGVAKGLHGILVDYPQMTPGLTLADERKLGARPYWCHIPANDIIACYWIVRNGRKVISHIRFKETQTMRVGFEETSVNRIRVYELDASGKPTWALWEEPAEGATDWVYKGGGPISLPDIPIGLFFVGERSGNYCVRPPLLPLAEMQIELYQGLSRQEEILTFAGSPMLQAEGMNAPSANRGPDGDQPLAPTINVGPKVVLYAPPGADSVPTKWSFVQPDAANIQEVRKHVESVQRDMSRLGKKPMMPKESGDVTATASALDAAEAHSEVSAWAQSLKDIVELCLIYTALWLSVQPTAEVTVNTDFGVGANKTADFDSLLKARMAGEISRETFWDECLRRGILAASFDKEIEKRRLEDEEASAREQDVETAAALAAAEAAAGDEPALGAV